MVTLPRFLATDLDSTTGAALLLPDEAHHLVHVMRLRPGDEIAVFDGAGREYRARIERIGREGAHVRLIEEIAALPEPFVRLTLAQAVLKTDKMDQVVRDATMMGVSAIVPLQSGHTSAVREKMSAGRAPLERWRRIAIASAKQCRRAVLPEIRAWTAVCDCIRQDVSERRFILVEPGAPQGLPLPSSSDRRPASASLMVGPEGGWSAEEIEAAVGAGWLPVTLGRRTLRADVAALVAMGILQYEWGDL
jgi:16S rRNA (uracil1498-N3)-methyltransferase